MEAAKGNKGKAIESRTLTTYVYTNTHSQSVLADNTSLLADNMFLLTFSLWRSLFCQQMEAAKGNKGKAIESRTLTAILSGLNRALPFAPPLTGLF